MASPLPNQINVKNSKSYRNYFPHFHNLNIPLIFSQGISITTWIKWITKNEGKNGIKYFRNKDDGLNKTREKKNETGINTFYEFHFLCEEIDRVKHFGIEKKKNENHAYFIFNSLKLNVLWDIAWISYSNLPSFWIFTVNKSFKNKHLKIRHDLYLMKILNKILDTTKL
jgi:hypothetical protein